MMTNSSNDPINSSTTIQLSFWRQIHFRGNKLVKTWQPYGSFAIAFLITMIVQHSPASKLSISSVAATGFSYASITISACISAIVLSLGLPGEDRLRKWALHGSEANKSALAELLFVFTWACLCQLFVIIICVLSFVFGGDGQVLPPKASFTHNFLLFASLLIFFYALFELFVIIETMWQIGAVIIHEERKSLKPKIERDGSPPKVHDSTGTKLG